MRTIEVDANQRELSPHGTLLYPLEINHDDLSTFQNGFVRCHWHEELELSIVRSGRAGYTLGGGVHVLQSGEGILINANVPHTSAPFGSENAVLLTVIVHPAFLYGLPGSVIESRLMRPFLASRRLSAVPLTAEETQAVLAVDELAQRRPFAWELNRSCAICFIRSLPAAAASFARALRSRKKLLRGWTACLPRCTRISAKRSIWRRSPGRRASRGRAAAAFSSE